jgi:RNA polymerase sigma-70 factor (ECF subfamily)
MVKSGEQQEGPADERLDRWVKTTWPGAVVYARSLLQDRSRAEDVVQESYCNLLRKAADYDLPADGTRLLMRSITNACVNANVRTRPLASFSALEIDPVDAGAMRPPRAVLHAELEKAVAAALEELPALQRAAIELKGLGHSQREIAEILEVSQANAGVLVHRGRQTLAVLLAPFLEDQADEPPGQRSAE